MRSARCPDTGHGCDLSERNRLIVDHLFLARCVAREIHATLPRHVDCRDLEQEGFIGLCKAADIYDQSRGFAFSAIARRKVYGAILDYLRSIDPLNKEDRTQVKAGRRDGVSVGPLDKTAYRIFVRPTQEFGAIEAQRAAYSRQARLGLGSRDAIVTHRHYYGEMTLREVGESLGISEGRASQIHQRALLAMRESLEAAGIHSASDF